jgi:hypothetical protein
MPLDGKSTEKVIQEFLKIIAEATKKIKCDWNFL